MAAGTEAMAVTGAMEIAEGMEEATTAEATTVVATTAVATTVVAMEAMTVEATTVRHTEAMAGPMEATGECCAVHPRLRLFPPSVLIQPAPAHQPRPCAGMLARAARVKTQQLYEASKRHWRASSVSSSQRLPRLWRLWWLWHIRRPHRRLRRLIRI